MTLPVKDTPTTLARLRSQALEMISVTKKGLHKHIRLVKNPKRLASIVATVEMLRGDVREGNAAALREHMARLQKLTQGFAGHRLIREAKRRSKNSAKEPK
mgnify:CR=1 FL=1